ncbi:MAG: class B sortase [Hespellia sp.]|nr:class B sortase [Hespellia sp.]
MSKKRKVIFWIAIIVLALCVGYLVYYFVGKAQRAKVYDKLQDQTVTKTEPVEEPEAPTEDTPVEIPIDFAALQTQYPDLYAWIEIPGIDGLSYPIMQREYDNTYYLNYTIDGEYGYPGSIYTENYNSKDFQDFDTIIYGHNMKDGSMFGSLKDYKDLDFLNNHRQIIIYTPEHIFTYQIFAAVTYDDRHILTNFNFEQDADKLSYITSITSLNEGENHVLNDITVNAGDRLLTLSTCISEQPSSRFLIEAVLIDEQ